MSAAIGGVDALVTFAGPAPGAVNGLVQVNARVPADAAAGPAIPLVLTVGLTAARAGSPSPCNKARKVVRGLPDKGRLGEARRPCA